MNKYYTISIFFIVIGSSYLIVFLYRWFCILDTQNTWNIFVELQNYRHVYRKDIINDWIRCSYLIRGNTQEIFAIPLIEDTIGKINEPILIFYKIYNTCTTSLFFNSHLYITPPEMEKFFVKIQCFCFQEQIIHNKEVLELPIFFFLENTNSKYTTISKHLIIHLALYVKHSL
jgi:cytochrome c oxidase assembly protein Cox11